jgi:hypothetical protein
MTENNAEVHAKIVDFLVRNKIEPLGLFAFYSLYPFCGIIKHLNVIAQPVKLFIGDSPFKILEAFSDQQNLKHIIDKIESRNG